MQTFQFDLQIKYEARAHLESNSAVQDLNYLNESVMKALPEGARRHGGERLEKRFSSKKLKSKGKAETTKTNGRFNQRIRKKTKLLVLNTLQQISMKTLTR